jgi:tRNA modification GTPase
MPFSTGDTIVAVATAPGRGGIGVVRVSGAEAMAIARRLAPRLERLEPRYATLGRVEGDGGIADEAVLTYFPGPRSYTGEDVLEISAHGSGVLLRAIVERAMKEGARLAGPGEFTLRAYLNGRIDLVQAEAVRDLVEAVTPLQARAAFDQLEGTLTGRIRVVDETLLDLVARLEASLDFPEEGYHFVDAGGAAAELLALAGQLDALLADAGRGRLLREGAQVVIVGRPNAGKSSLFNRLAGAGRAIVTDIPGTTRDLVTEAVDVEGVPVTLVDTAGVREVPGDPVEAEGIARTRGAQAIASLVVVVLDGSAPLTAEDRHVLEATRGQPRLVVASKRDLPAAWQPGEPAAATVDVSAETGMGIDRLRRAMAEALGGGPPARDVPAITNARHAALLGQARAALLRAAAAAGDGTPEEFVLLDVNEARGALEEVTGARTADDVLRRIFESFCIGK